MSCQVVKFLRNKSFALIRSYIYMTILLKLLNSSPTQLTRDYSKIHQMSWSSRQAKAIMNKPSKTWLYKQIRVPKRTYS